MPEKNNSTMRILKGLMLKSLPGMITCIEFEQFIIDYLEDTLPQPKRKLFERHLKVCRECREYLERYQLTKALYTEKIQSDSGNISTEVPSELIAAIIEASSAKRE